MPIAPATWLDFIEILDDESRSGTELDEEHSGILSALFNNQEHLRELQIDTTFPETNVTSATYVNVVTKKLWIPAWCAIPVSGALSSINFVCSYQSKQTGATDHDVRVRIDGGSWKERLNLTTSIWTSPEVITITDVDWDADAAAGTEVDYEVEALVTGGGSVDLRDISCCSFLRRANP